MLQPAGVGETSEARMRGRLLREARAMARLSHPNVLAVYDVGELDGQVFLAMELIEGGTLTAWPHEKRRSWREVLHVFLDAARGLAAAHAAGLIHRDFKPDNVLVGADGRVRVTDFGLASALALGPADLAKGGNSKPGPSVTVTALGGSPAYMAPEQLRGERVDARADVFSYCVALHEALYRERPFRGDSLEELEGAIRRDEVLRPRRGSGVPGWLRGVVLHRLRHDPGKRFQSMDALIAALEKGRRGARRRARRRATAGAVLLSVVAALSLVLAGPWRQRLTARAPGAGLRSLAVLPLEDGHPRGDREGEGVRPLPPRGDNIASAYALLGQPGDAVHWLRWAAGNGFPCYPLFASDPNLARIRQDPGYVALMDELKAQWERYRATLSP